MSIRSRWSHLCRAVTASSRFAALALQSLVVPSRRLQFRAAANAIGAYEIPPGLQTRTIAQLFGTDAPVTLSHTQPQTWQTTTQELASLAAIVRIVKPRAIFEFGTFDGRTTLNLLDNAPPGCRVTTLDMPAGGKLLPDGKVAGGLIADHIRDGRIEQLLCDSRSLPVGDDLRGQFDLIFIDANHAYAYVVSDTHKASQLARGPGAVIIWHDYATLGDVTRAVDEFTRDKPDAARLEGTSLAVWIVR
jgi:predicted O-methyltransferase YrrM